MAQTRSTPFRRACRYAFLMCPSTPRSADGCRALSSMCRSCERRLPGLPLCVKWGCKMDSFFHFHVVKWSEMNLKTPRSCGLTVPDARRCAQVP